MRSFLVAAALFFSAPPGAPEGLRLRLEQVLLLRSDADGTTVSCRARWDNGTGAPLAVTTGFGSVFDGVSIVAVDRDGREVARQAAVYHQSPASPPRTIPLGEGETAGDVVFVLDGVSLGDIAAVRLEGGLMGQPEPLSSGFATEWRDVYVFR